LEVVLASRARELGESHPDTLRTRHNMAFAYRRAGRVAEAVPMYEAVLAGLTAVLGSGHPDTVLARENLARVKGTAE
jgi:hypothetical protein